MWHFHSDGKQRADTLWMLRRAVHHLLCFSVLVQGQETWNVSVVYENWGEVIGFVLSDLQS